MIHAGRSDAQLDASMTRRTVGDGDAVRIEVVREPREVYRYDRTRLRVRLRCMRDDLLTTLSK